LISLQGEFAGLAWLGLVSSPAQKTLGEKNIGAGLARTRDHHKHRHTMVKEKVPVAKGAKSELSEEAERFAGGIAARRKTKTPDVYTPHREGTKKRVASGATKPKPKPAAAGAAVKVWPFSSHTTTTTSRH
jgi:hypothetical protein